MKILNELILNFLNLLFLSKNFLLILKRKILIFKTSDYEKEFF